MRYTRLSAASEAYVSAREALRAAEFELMQRREDVAELQRQLPHGPILDDYTLLEVRATWAQAIRRSTSTSSPTCRSTMNRLPARTDT